jgi:hypothetical protein
MTQYRESPYQPRGFSPRTVVLANDTRTPNAPWTKALRLIRTTIATTTFAKSPATTQPVATQPATQALNCSIKSITGLVQFRIAKDEPWQKATADTKLDQDAEIRMGVRSSVQLEYDDHNIVTLNRLGVFTVLDLRDNPTSRPSSDFLKVK